MKILKKASHFLSLGKEEFSPTDPVEKIIDSLGDKFSGLLELTFSERLGNDENSQLDPTQVKAVIEKYSKLNVAIAAASAAVPGPLGILSSAGEMVLVTGNQLKMIYDLGCAHGKENLLTKDLLLDIPLQSMGVSTNLDEVQNQLNSFSESPTEILQEKATEYAKVIAIKNLQKSLVKCVPVGGSLLMSVWTKKSTKKIGKVAESFLDDAATLPHLDAKSGFQEEEPKEVLVEKIKVLATLMEQNGEIKESELAFLVPIIEQAALEENESTHLLNEAKRLGSHFDIDFTALREFGDTADDLMTDLVILAKRDGTVGPNELAYLKYVCHELGEEEADLLELID